MCCKSGINLIEYKETIELLRQTLKVLSEKYNFEIYAYCFMPDHIHLLIEGKKPDSGMRRFISMFKQKTGFEFKKEFKKDLWQINYYEHVLRKEEDTSEVVKYIFGNPVRRNIVDNYEKYPYLGSFVFMQA